MYTPWRLAKAKVDKLDLPVLDKGYYWMLTKGEFAAVRIRKRVVWPFLWTQIAHNYVASNATKQNYQYAIQHTFQEYQAWLERKQETW